MSLPHPQQIISPDTKNFILRSEAFFLVQNFFFFYNFFDRCFSFETPLTQLLYLLELVSMFVFSLSLIVHFFDSLLHYRRISYFFF